MTIDQKRMFELEMKYCGEDVSPELAELTEVFRLARLGLWAEKHGIPALSTLPPACRSFDIEKQASAWASVAPHRWAQHFYEGALYARTEIMKAKEKALAQLPKGE